MSYKDLNAAKSTKTRNLMDLIGETGNVYESIVIMSKRADQINKEQKEELNSKLQEFATVQDNLEEVFENREQIEISKFYERLPKPFAYAIEEFRMDQTYFRLPEPEEDEESGITEE